MMRDIIFRIYHKVLKYGDIVVRDDCEMLGKTNIIYYSNTQCYILITPADYNA